MSTADKCRQKIADQKAVWRLDEILAKENPCAIKVKDGKATCRAGTPCCQGCRHLGAKGCTVNSVACKFYFCDTAWAALSKEAQDEIKKLGAGYRGILRNRFDGFILASKPPLVW